MEGVPCTCMGAELRNDELAADDPRRPLDPRDYSRRTLLANERTYLAWWRTGLTTLTVAIAFSRVVPELSKAGTTWPYTAIGVGFAALGVFCIAYGERRRRAVDLAIHAGGFAEISGAVSLLLTAAASALGLAMILLILVNP